MVDDTELARAIRAAAQTLYHPVGTCRMGEDERAVTDPRLRVRGVTGLRVVDASVMPRITRGHTHAPTVALAERAAELIRADARVPAGR
ncbi:MULTISPECIES: GMC oxidoreductase [unclassified Streptomyces]|uniref:GMC oxidoreductase n=1 Tax=unclassified Streptomyces TaxID=2593676 RepID=UPI00344E5533